MRDRPGFKTNILLSLLGAVVLGALTLAASPVLVKNIKFLLALPFVAVIFFIMVLNIKTMFVLLLMTRALLDPILAQTKDGGSGSGIGGVINLFVVLMVGLLIIRWPGVLKRNRYVLLWAVFLGVAALTGFYSPKPMGALKLLLNLATYAAFFSVPFFLVKDEKEKKFWIKTVLISSFVPVAFANLGFVTGHPLLNNPERLSGMFTHANILAFYLVFVIMLTVYVLRTHALRLTLPLKALLWLYLIDLFALLVVTQTRSAWFSCVVMFLIYGLLKERKMLLVLMLGAGLILPLPTVKIRLQDLTEGTGVKSGEKLNSWVWRVKLWKGAWPHIERRILVGHGLGSFQRLSKQFTTKERWGTPAHNVYVELIFETGIFGVLAYLSIFLALLGTFFRRYRRTVGDLSRESALLFSYLIGYLLVCVSDNALYYLAFNWYLWFFVGVIIQGGMLHRPPVPATQTAEYGA